MSDDTYGFDPLLKALQPEGVYIPQHMVDYGRGRGGHCCFAGCTPMGCPAGCCVFEGFGHRANCPLNPQRQMDEREHDAYIQAGMAQHFRRSREEVLAAWREQCAVAAARMGPFDRLSLQERQVRVTLEVLSKDNNLMDLVYDFGRQPDA